MVTATAILLGSQFLGVQAVSAQEQIRGQTQGQVFTADSLAQYDGRDGRPAYFAYDGQVYDVTTSKLWKLGEHFGVQAGKDLTGKLGDAPHGTEVFSRFPMIGSYQAAAAESGAEVEEAKKVDASPATTKSQSSTSWFTGRIRILGISILGWTGILLGVFFFLTFFIFLKIFIKFPY